MDRYVSNFTNRLDAKGRVSIPSTFRSVLSADGYEGLYVHPSLDAVMLECGGFALLREIDGLLENYAPYSEEREWFSTALLGTSEVLKIDSEGRVSLSEGLKAHAGITGEVTFVGQGHKFQIWEPSRFRTHLEEARNQVRDRKKRFGAKAAAADPPRVPGARE